MKTKALSVLTVTLFAASLTAVSAKAQVYPMYGMPMAFGAGNGMIQPMPIYPQVPVYPTTLPMQGNYSGQYGYPMGGFNPGYGFDATAGGLPGLDAATIRRYAQRYNGGQPLPQWADTATDVAEVLYNRYGR